MAKLLDLDADYWGQAFKNSPSTGLDVITSYDRLLCVVLVMTCLSASAADHSSRLNSI